MKKTHIVLEKEGGVADFQWKAKDGGWSMVVDGCPVETSSRFNQKITNGNPTLLLQLEEWSAILGRSKRGMGIGQGEISS